MDPAQTWAEDMTRLPCEVNDTAGHAHAIEERLLAVYQHRHQQIIDAGTAANPSPPGHGVRSPAANLLARIGGFVADVLRFAHDLRMPFDNNLAERDIRVVKLRQKISGGLHTWTGAETSPRSAATQSTTRKQAINALEALTRLHNGQIWLPITSWTVAIPPLICPLFVPWAPRQGDRKHDPAMPTGKQKHSNERHSLRRRGSEMRQLVTSHENRPEPRLHAGAAAAQRRCRSYRPGATAPLNLRRHVLKGLWTTKSS
jgi:transposase